MINKKRKFLGELGKISKELIILGGIVITAIIVIAVVISAIIKPPPPPPGPVKKEPVYEITLGDVRFKLKEVKDRGNILEASESKNPNQRKGVSTTERFIEVTMSAENVGKDNVQSGSWGMKEVLDSEGSKFYSSRQLDVWTPAENKCGVELKPRFSPTLCTKIYEVAKVSSGLKVEVFAKRGSGGNFIDLGL